MNSVPIGTWTVSETRILINSDSLSLSLSLSQRISLSLSPDLSRDPQSLREWTAFIGAWRVDPHMRGLNVTYLTMEAHTT